MLGVAINVLAVLLGTFLGMTIGRFLKEDVRKTIMQALGVCVVVIGVSDALKTNNSLLVILSVVIGGFLGSVLHISDGLDMLGDCLQKKISKNGESKIGEGFVSATMIFCVGAMTVYGSISAGLGDNFFHQVRFRRHGCNSASLLIRYRSGIFRNPHNSIARWRCAFS